MNILFTCAGRRVYLLRYFKDIIKNEGLIIATDMQLSAPALMFADVKIQVPSVYAENYVDVTLGICLKYNIDLLIPLNDLELPILSMQKKRFEDINVEVLVSDTDIIETCFDKYKTAQYLLEIGLNTPKTYIDYNKALDDLETNDLHFPIILKPRWGSGSIGIEIVYDLEELHLVYGLLNKRIQRSILSKASSRDPERTVLIQEYIKGDEFGLDIMNDLEGTYWSVSVKRKLVMRAGETDKAMTVENETLEMIGTSIGKNLKHIANLDCDILTSSNGNYVLELNPRFGGGYPFSHEAGVNLPLAIIRWYKQEKVEASILKPRFNKVISKYDNLVEIENG